MARNRPVNSWVIRHSPSREPKFHQAEILDGAGRSTRASLAMLANGWALRRGIVHGRCVRFL